MPEITAGILAAAESAMADVMTDPKFRTERSCEGLSRAALEAAVPLLRAEIAARIAAQKQPCTVLIHRVHPEAGVLALRPERRLPPGGQDRSWR